jgi:excisionase family DNA binding protein
MIALNAVGATAEHPRLLYTFDEAADQLRCSGRQIRTLVLSGDLNSCHIGRLHRIAASDLEEYVRRLQAGSGTMTVAAAVPETTKAPSVELDALNEEDGVAATDPR